MLCRHFFPALLTICFVTATLRAGNAISFDFDPATDNGQADYFFQTDLAGAPGERVAHWNTLSYGDSNGVFTLNSIHDSTGTTISGMTLTTGATGTRSPSIGFSSSNTSEYGGSHAAYGNDSKFFDHFLDYTSNSPVSITVTNIPFTLYSVVFYRSDQENSNPSSNATAASGYVGGFTIGSKTEYVRGGPAVSGSVVPYSNTPDSTGSPYIISSDTTNKASSTVQGNTVVFANLASSTLTASIFAGDSTGAPDTRVSGFQIVDMSSTPEPASIAPLAISLVLVRRLRIRSSIICA